MHYTEVSGRVLRAEARHQTAAPPSTASQHHKCPSWRHGVQPSRTATCARNNSETGVPARADRAVLLSRGSKSDAPRREVRRHRHPSPDMRRSRLGAVCEAQR